VKGRGEIYLRALRDTGLEPRECAAIEDSHNGVEAAKNAGLFVVATTNPYTEKEDLSRADIVVSCLGDPDGESGTLRRGGAGLKFDGVLRLRQILAFFDR
jgi:beta-phosphoglucomutase-like phosphatase (HAD superfamily)